MALPNSASIRHGAQGRSPGYDGLRRHSTYIHSYWQLYDITHMRLLYILQPVIKDVLPTSRGGCGGCQDLILLYRIGRQS